MIWQVFKYFCFYAELKLAMLCVGTSEASEGSSRLPETIVSSKSPSIACRNDDSQATNEIRSLEEELKNKDKEIEALKVGFYIEFDILYTGR